MSLSRTQVLIILAIMSITMLAAMAYLGLSVAWSTTPTHYFP